MTTLHPMIPVVNPSDPMRGWRRNRWLIGGLIVFLLGCIFLIAWLLRANSIENGKTLHANGQLKIALTQADQFRAERDDLIKRAGTLKPGSPAQTQVLKQLQSTTGQPLSNGLNGAPGLPGANGAPGLNGFNGVAGVNGTNGVSGPAGGLGAAGAVGSTGSTGLAGSTGANGVQGDPGPTGAPGPAGPTGPTGAEPSAFTFTTSDGTVYDCTPDGGAHYTCTPRPATTANASSSPSLGDTWPRKRTRLPS